jgi:hypothetical protein
VCSKFDVIQDKADLGLSHAVKREVGRHTSTVHSADPVLALSHRSTAYPIPLEKDLARARTARSRLPRVGKGRRALDLSDRWTGGALLAPSPSVTVRARPPGAARRSGATTRSLPPLSVPASLHRQSPSGQVPPAGPVPRARARRLRALPGAHVPPGPGEHHASRRPLPHLRRKSGRQLGS